MNALSSIDQLIDQPERVQSIRRSLEGFLKGFALFTDLSLPYVDGVENLPADGRFLLVGNHTQTGMGEVWLTSLAVGKAIGTRVRPLINRDMAKASGVIGDTLAAYGGVLGSPENAAELMRHGETVLVFPGGGREIPKFKGEEYTLNWEGRAGFARVAIANGYPIVPVGHVGGDDIYHSVVKRDSLLGKLTLAVNTKLGIKMGGGSDMVFSPVRGLGPTLIPSPQRMYLRFGSPVDTAQPAGVADDEWVAIVKERTQTRLEAALAGLLQVRADDPYRELNPLARGRASRPARPSGPRE